MAHTCPECGQYCTCNGDWDDIDFGEDLDCCHCPAKSLDIVVTDDDLTNILPLGKQGCKECAPLSYYCDECTRKIYVAQHSVQSDGVRACPDCMAQEQDGVIHHKHGCSTVVPRN